MNSRYGRYRYFVFLMINLLCASGVLGSARGRERGNLYDGPDYGANIVYVSPVPGSAYHTPTTSIIVRSNEDINPASIRQVGLFAVYGSMSGQHSGKIISADDNRTVLFEPQVPFALGEKVTVSMTHPLLSVDGDTIYLSPFSFTISGVDLNADKAFVSQLPGGFGNVEVPPSAQSAVNQHIYLPDQSEKINHSDSLPSDFPVLTVTQSDSPSHGYIFLATNVQPNSYGNFLIIADNQGNPVFYRREPGPVFDFTIQPTGVLTYCVGPSNTYYVMNTSLEVVDSIKAVDGYQTNNHELQILPNGDIFLLANDYEQIDMSKIVPGGNPNATVVEEVIQEFDQNKNLIFQWRTIDHFQITDAIGQDLTAASVDPFHANAIAVDPDGTILLSCRHTSEITKIDPAAGNIIWRLGGKNNEFRFVNDTIGFSYQHDIRRMANGDITMMDNGNMHNPPFSRALEYKLDEVNLTATLIWQLRHVPDVYDSYMGNVQRLDDGNTIIGWGGAHTPTVTEVRHDGTTAFEMTFPYVAMGTYNLALSYRAFRFPFLFITSPSTSDTAIAGGTAVLRWESRGVYSVDIDCSTDGINWSNLTVNYPAKADSIVYTVPNQAGSTLLFRAIQSGLVDRGMTFYSDTIPVVNVTPIIKPKAQPYTYSLSDNYPNPFNPTTTISYEIAEPGHVTLKVYNLLGQAVATIVDGSENPGTHDVTFDGSKFASGVYFYQLRAGNFVATKKMIVVK